MVAPTMKQPLPWAETIDDLVALIPRTEEVVWHQMAIAQATAARNGVRNEDLATFCARVESTAKSNPVAFATLQAVISLHVDPHSAII
jgi:hypothetical protein